MKKTFNVNLAGIPFIIDEDAYQLLSQYFETLSHIYSDSTESDEFMRDIESRCAELLMTRTAETGASIVNIAMAESVIEQIGHPDEFEEVEISPDGISEESISTPPPITPVNPQPRHKRLFRDPENKLIAGVCSGIAAYLNLDPTLVRLLTVALCFLSFSVASFAYIILWIVVPEALTPAQRMQMVGENPTISNIGRTVTNMFNSEGQPTPPQKTGFAYKLSRIFAICAKVLLVFVALISIPIVFVIVLAFFAMMIALIANICGWAGWGLSSLFPSNSITLLLITGLGVCFAIGIPLAVVIWLIISAPSHKTMRPATRNSLVIAWIIGLTVAFAGSMMCKFTGAKENLKTAIEKIDNDDDDEEIETTVTQITSDTTAVNDTTYAASSTDTTVISKNGKTITMTDDQIQIEKPGKKKIIKRR